VVTHISRSINCGELTSTKPDSCWRGGCNSPAPGTRPAFRMPNTEPGAPHRKNGNPRSSGRRPTPAKCQSVHAAAFYDCVPSRKSSRFTFVMVSIGWECEHRRRTTNNRLAGGVGLFSFGGSAGLRVLASERAGRCSRRWRINPPPQQESGFVEVIRPQVDGPRDVVTTGHIPTYNDMMFLTRQARGGRARLRHQPRIARATCRSSRTA